MSKEYLFDLVFIPAAYGFVTVFAIVVYNFVLLYRSNPVFFDRFAPGGF
jgi:hypothetical protein